MCSPAGGICRLDEVQCNATATCCAGNVMQVMVCRQDNLGIDQEAVFKDEAGRVHIRPRLFADLKFFARRWDRNIAQQGFLKGGADVQQRS